MGDYSCYVTIKNNLDVDLTQTSNGIVHGSWKTSPPDTISANSSSGQFQLKDNLGAYGSEGWVSYRVELEDAPSDDKKPVLTFNFQCPTGTADNKFTISPNVAAALFMLDTGSVSTSGHPLTVTGTVGFNYALTTTSVATSVTMPYPQLNVYNSKGDLHKKNNLEIWNNSQPSSFEDNDTKDVAGSLYPVSADLAQSSNVTVEFNIDANLTSIPFYIQGDIGSSTGVIRSDDVQFFESTGSQKISMVVSPSWASTTFPWGIAGDVVWKLDLSPTDQHIQCNSSRLEIYSMSKSLPNFFHNRIDVGILRLWVLAANNTSETDWCTYVIKSAFNKYAFAFDTTNGAAKYATDGSGGNYKLQDWAGTVNSGADINDYDQAGIVQIALCFGTNGSSDWYYMSPFGYIITTSLVGIGSCNNPLYDSNGTTALIANNDANRTGFKNHAFLKVSNKNNQIADACIGPHLADETLDTYISACIEQDGDTSTTTTLYRSHKDMGPGKSSNASSKSGVTSIDGRTSSSSSSSASVSARSFQHPVIASLDFAGRGNDSIMFSNFDLPMIREFLAQGSVLYHSHTVTAKGSDLSWFLESESGPPTTVEIFVHHSHDNAVEYFRSNLLRYQAPLEDILIVPKGPLRKGGICLVSPPQSQRGHMSWVRGNIFARVCGPKSVNELDAAYIKMIDDSFVAHKTDEAQLLVPRITKLSVPAQVKQGEELTVYASVIGCNKSSVNTGNNDVITLLRADVAKHEFQLLAGQFGQEVVQFSFAHPISAVVATKGFKIHVIA